MRLLLVAARWGQQLAVSVLLIMHLNPVPRYHSPLLYVLTYVLLAAVGVVSWSISSSCVNCRSSTIYTHARETLQWLHFISFQVLCSIYSTQVARTLTPSAQYLSFFVLLGERDEIR